ncbi:MAG: hypothetical protein OHK0029_22440 [Armatimonadaceae bacterium]
MINFKNREEVLPSTLIVLAILILALTLGYMLIVPPPNAAGVVKGRETSRRKIENEIETAKTRGAAAQQSVRPLLWEGSTEAITAGVLAKVTYEVNRQKLRMAAFRPQKPQTLENLTELSYSIQMAGPYKAVRDALAVLDSPSSKMALRSLQVASADGASSEVTATLNLSVYTAPAAVVGRGGRDAADDAEKGGQAR